MVKKLYVGNLSYNVTEEALSELFGTVGEVVSATLITDRLTGRSRGFGFIEMATEAEAQQAIAKLNNSLMDERQITVAEARPRKPRPDRGGYRGRRRY
ncbi:MAG: RNA recognition motif domain-containing protein [Anaerolineae bacterium]